MLKLTDNPPLLSPTAGRVLDLPGTWWVAHTKPRQEKALAFDLLRAGVGYFLPMTMRTIFSGGRKRRSMHPLFTGYVFVCGDEDARGRALSTNRVAGGIPIVRQEQFVAEIDQIERALGGETAVEMFPHLARGKPVTVVGGPLAGVRGTVVGYRNAGDGAGELAEVVIQVSVMAAGASWGLIDEPEIGRASCRERLVWCRSRWSPYH